jgi:hypothetical protein
MLRTADELLMSMALRVAGHHRAIEDIQHGEERSSFHPVCNRPLWFRPGPLLVECLNLAFLVNGQNNGVRRRIDAEPDERRAS